MEHVQGNSDRHQSADHQFKPTHLSADDKRLLESYVPIAEGIVRIFGPTCEVVLHSLEDMGRSVIAIYNGEISGRTVGSPITSLGLEILKRSMLVDERIVGPYFSRGPKGNTVKSASILIRNPEGVTIGFLCINFNISSPLADFVAQFSDPTVSGGAERIDHFVSGMHELIHKALEKEMKRVSDIKGIAPSEKNKLIVQALEDLGLFDIKGAVELTAKEMGLSRFTIYGYLRGMRKNEHGSPVREARGRESEIKE